MAPDTPKIQFLVVEPSSSTADGIKGKKKETNRWTPETYARQIYSFSRRSTKDLFYPGEHYDYLAQFLIRTYHTQISESITPTTENIADFLTLHHLDNENGNKAMGFRTPEEFENDTNNLGAPQIVFLKGYPSPKWLCSIGARIQWFPPQPSCINVIQFRITSLGCWDTLKSGESVDSVRSESRAGMLTYLEDLRRSRNVTLSDSIVRNFHVYDQIHFSVEQTISIHLNNHGDEWALLVWTDIGNDLGSSSTTNSPWLDMQRRHSSVTRFIPVVQHRERLALKALSSPSARQNVPEITPHLAQSCSWMHTDIGTSLDKNMMKCDPFYALTEIFKFATATEYQFLDLMRTKIQEATILESSGEGRIRELHVIKDIIDEHYELLSENLDTVRARGGAEWPKAPKDTRMQKKAEVATAKLIKDYESILSKTKHLSQKCKDASSIMRNDAMYRESQIAIKQSEALAKLTLLAFFFVPLSFTASFFGMNFRELQNPDHPLKIWIWFAVSIPVLGVSCIILFWHTRRVIPNSVASGANVDDRLFPNTS